MKKRRPPVDPLGILRPCSECPFNRGPGGVRLTRERAREIAENALSHDGKIFWCHKTTTNGGAARGRRQHCAGSLIFSEKNGVLTQAMRIAGRLGLYDPHRLGGRDDVFDSVAELLGANR